MNKEIEKLIDDGVGIEEIAEKFSGEDCVEAYGMKIPSTCHEDADCCDCWCKCLEKCLSQQKFKEENGMKKLIWNEDMDMVYGVKNNFENEKDFVEHVNEEYQNIRGNQCLIGDVAIKCCISTCEGIDAESITPLDDTDIEINNYYIADVEEVE